MLDAVDWETKTLCTSCSHWLRTRREPRPGGGERRQLLRASRPPTAHADARAAARHHQARQHVHPRAHVPQPRVRTCLTRPDLNVNSMMLPTPDQVHDARAARLVVFDCKRVQRFARATPLSTYPSPPSPAASRSFPSPVPQTPGELPRRGRRLGRMDGRHYLEVDPRITCDFSDPVDGNVSYIAPWHRAVRRGHSRALFYKLFRGHCPRGREAGGRRWG